MDQTDLDRMRLEMEQAQKPAFGVFPQMRARRTQQDPEAAKHVPVDVARGVAAGTAGAPGDIEKLARLLINWSFGPGGVRVPTDTVLPTSEEVLQVIPGGSDTPAGRGAAGFGTLLGGAYTGPGSGVRAATAVAGALPKAARDFVQAAGQPATNVIKRKGGNWLTGDVEGVMDTMKVDSRGVGVIPLDEAEKAAYQRLGYTEYDPNTGVLMRPETDPVNLFIDKKLNKYIKNEMATAEDPVRLQADAFVKEKADMLAAKDKQLEKARADLQKTQQERGVAPEVLTRSQARIRELEKERDFINELQGLHFSPRHIYERDRADLAVHRPEQGFPAGGLGESDLARAWENAADVATNLDTAGAYQASAGAKMTSPWLEKLPPSTPVYAMTGSDKRALGLDHLTDELRNALNPNSGLPEKLLLTPEKLSKMNVPQAVKHVDEINAWRAVQKREADAARAANEATHTIKEYPEAGKRWVELKMPDFTGESLPEGYKVLSGRLGDKTLYRVVDPSGESVVNKGGTAMYASETEAEAVQEALRELKRSSLEDALKYEGEMLQHCVGGYCPRVLRGDSRIISLRDTAGRPQVTIEMQPLKGMTPYDVWYKNPLTPQTEITEFLNWIKSDKTRMMQRLENELYKDKRSRGLDELYRQWAAETGRPIKAVPDNVAQIKTAKNALVSGENVQYVKDFLNSHPVGTVKDLPPTLVDLNDTTLLTHYAKDITGYPDARAANAVLNDALDHTPNLPRFITTTELRDLLKPKKYAAGGEVSRETPQDLLFLMSQPDLAKLSPQAQREAIANMSEREFVDRMRSKYAAGGLVTAPPDDFLAPDMSDGGRTVPDPDYMRLALQQR